jgi:hypothetical protein
MDRCAATTIDLGPRPAVVGGSSMVSIDPDDLDRAFDLIDALESSDEYSGGTEVTALCSYPSYLSLDLRRVLARPSRRHAWGAAMSCLIDHGVRHYYRSEIVSGFIEQFSTLDKNDDIDALTIEHLELWRKQVRFSLNDPTNLLGFQKRHVFKSPEIIRNKLSGLAGKLGISNSVLGAVCVMVGLEEQPGVPPEHASAMRAEIERFDRVLVAWEKRLSTLIRLAQEGVWP